MRVDGPNRPRPAAKPAAKKRAGAAKGSSASVRVADAASLQEKAKVMFAELPEVRLQRIEAIRERLARGDYEVPPREVAKKIVLNALAEVPWR
ncbi:MAG: flagellar biosynthesis anti-sigma factor FlgM [Zetaproteobacteria bacterium]|nr:MAG: flagellar biosynthesis anti-sigma factor FlgM [Zetaproteobacteria bacterium]